MHPQFRQTKLAFYKEAYERQLERRTHALERLSHIVTIYTLVGGIIVYFVTTISLPEYIGASLVVFGLGFSAGVVAYAIGFAFLIVTLHRGTTLKVLDAPESYERVFSASVTQLPDTEPYDQALVEGFEVMMSDQYRELASLNQMANNVRDGRYSTIFRFGIWSLSLLVVSSPAFFILQKQDLLEPTEVIIKNPIEIMSTPNTQNSQPNAQNTTAPAASSQSSSAPTQSERPVVRFVPPPPQALNESFAAKREDIQTMQRKQKEN